MRALPTWDDFLIACLRVLEDGEVQRRREIIEAAATRNSGLMESRFETSYNFPCIIPAVDFFERAMAISSQSYTPWHALLHSAANTNCVAFDGPKPRLLPS